MVPLHTPAGMEALVAEINGEDEEATGARRQGVRKEGQRRSRENGDERELGKRDRGGGGW